MRDEFKDGIVMTLLYLREIRKLLCPFIEGGIDIVECAYDACEFSVKVISSLNEVNNFAVNSVDKALIHGHGVGKCAKCGVKIGNCI